MFAGVFVEFLPNGMEEVFDDTSLVPHHILDEAIGFLEGEVVVFGRLLCNIKRWIRGKI